MHTLFVESITLSIALIGGSWLCGWLIEWLILKVTTFWCIRTAADIGTIFTTALRGLIRVGFVAAGAAIALTRFNLPGEHYLWQIQQTVVILTITIAIMRLIIGGIEITFKRANSLLPASSLLLTATRIVILLIGLLTMLQNVFAISILPILTTLGVGGLAVALALQDTLANLFAGLYIIMARKIRPGDYIKIDMNDVGFVVDISLRNTTIKALDNNLIIIPNAKLAAATITNYHLPEQEMLVLINSSISYENDLKHIERITTEVAKEVMQHVPGGVPEFEPLIRYNAFFDYSINFTVILRVQRFVDQYPIKHEFIKRLHERYLKEGIEVPSSMRNIYIEKADKTERSQKNTNNNE